MSALLRSAACFISAQKEASSKAEAGFEKKTVPAVKKRLFRR
jgi:hypothetical protein